MQAIMGNDEAEGSPNIAAQGCRDHSDPLVRSQMGYEYLGRDLRDIKLVKPQQSFDQATASLQSRGRRCRRAELRSLHVVGAIDIAALSAAS